MRMTSSVCLLVLVLASNCGGDEDDGGPTCADDNGGCDTNATCTATSDGPQCECTRLYEGDGKSCTLWIDPSRAACSAFQAEHPGYTNIARDVALCGSHYDPTNIDTACNTGW